MEPVESAQLTLNMILQLKNVFVMMDISSILVFVLLDAIPTKFMLMVHANANLDTI
jgi:hypothetical protein